MKPTNECHTQDQPNPGKVRLETPFRRLFPHSPTYFVLGWVGVGVRCLWISYVSLPNQIWHLANTSNPFSSHLLGQ